MSKIMNNSNWVCIGCTYRKMYARQARVNSEYELCEECKNIAFGYEVVHKESEQSLAKTFEKLILKRMGI